MSSSVAAMLGARSIAVVGASARPDSFGHRMVTEALRSTAAVHLVNPRYPQIDGQPCAPSLSELGTPVDLVLLGVGDHQLESQLKDAAAAGARSAVVFGGAHLPGLREQLRHIASDAGMALCGAGCMGFVNLRTGLRALGYLERDPIPAGPVSLITHSGSVFSTLLRTRRAIGYRLAVSSGQELVTTTAGYLEYVLDHEPDGGLIALVLETVRAAPQLRAQLHRAATLGVPVVLLPVGGSATGSQLVETHSGALAGTAAMWEALCDDTGALGVRDLAELTDTVELLALRRRKRLMSSGADSAGPRGIATIHDSGAERALTADLAAELGVPFAAIGTLTRDRLGQVLDDGLVAENPLDVWGTGADTRTLLRECLLAMDGDPAVAATVLAVDLVPEYDADTAYPDAVLDAAAQAAGPVAVLTSVASAVDDVTAQRLRMAGIPVLEGTRSGLVALRNLLQLNESAAQPDAVQHAPAVIDRDRRARWRARLTDAGPLSGAEPFRLLADYGISAARLQAADREADALAAAARLGYPVVLKTGMPGIAHKSDVGGVLLGLQNEDQVRGGYRELRATFGPSVLVCATAPPGIEVSLGVTQDPHVGPMVVLAAGGTLIELVADRVVALPPISAIRAQQMIGRLRIWSLLNGFRGAPPCDIESLALAVCGMSQLALELGDRLSGLDVNPVIVSAQGAVAVDVLVQTDQKMA